MADFLARIPTWGYFVLLAVTFMVFHLLTLDLKRPRKRGRIIMGQIGSSVMLLLALIVLQPTQPASILFALVGAVLAGVISGSTSSPPPPRNAKAEAPEETKEE